MHTHTLAGLSLVVLAGAAGVPARAADGAPATSTVTTQTDPGTRASETAPRLYTNADLAKFGPPAATTAPRRETAPVDEAQAWAFVQAVLDREAARLEADRRYALERGRAMPESGDDWGVDGGYLPGYYGGYYGYGFGYGFGDFGRDDHRLGDRFRTNRGFTEGLIPRGNHGRYSFLKGADVVPGPKSPGDRGDRSGKPGHRPGGGQVGHHRSGRR